MREIRQSGSEGGVGLRPHPYLYPIDTPGGDMAKEDWIEIYRSYSGEELNAEIAQLRKDVRGSFLAQGHGGTSHQRDLGELRDRLAAATRVRNGGGAGAWKTGRADFSGNRWDD